MSPIGRAYVADAEKNHEEDDGDFHHHDRGIEGGAFLDSDHQNRSDDQRNAKRGKVKAYLHAEKMRRVDQIVAALNEFGRLGADHFAYAREEGLRSLHQSRGRGVDHLPGDDVFRFAQGRPVVVGEPERHAQMENVEKLDEMVGPAGRYGAGAHGVFQREVPADDPGENFAERGISVGVRAARERNKCRKFRVAEARERAA